MIMAKPTTQGIGYFNIDVHFDPNTQEYLTETEGVGLGVLIAAWQTIYSDEGYFAHYGNSFFLSIKRRIYTPVEVIKNCIDRAVPFKIFDADMLEKYNVITSKALQKRYFDAAKRKKFTRFNPEIMLVDVNAYKNLLNVNIYTENVSAHDPNVNVNVNVNEEGKEETALTVPESQTPSFFLPNKTEALKSCKWIQEYLADKQITILTGFGRSPLELEDLFKAGRKPEEVHKLYQFFFEVAETLPLDARQKKDLIYHQGQLSSVNFGKHMAEKWGQMVAMATGAAVQADNGNDAVRIVLERNKAAQDAYSAKREKRMKR